MTAGLRAVLGQDDAIVTFLVVDGSNVFAVRSNHFHVFLNVQTLEYVVLPSLMGERLVGGHSSTDVAIWTAKVPARPAPPEQQGRKKDRALRQRPVSHLSHSFLLS